MPDQETPADRLRAAADRIRGNFTRDRLVDDLGRVCVVGAILGLRCTEDLDTTAYAVLLTDADSNRAIVALSQYLYPDHPRGYEISLAQSWNDTKCRDGEEAATTMEKAAAAWEETHG